MSPYLRSTFESYHEVDNCLYYKCLIKGKEGGKLSGKTITVKDTVQIAGLPLMNGSHVLEGFTPVEDATIIRRLLDNGITITGKTHCEDLCFSGSSFTNVKGPVHNAVYPGYNAGGSSSGSGVAVAKGISDIAIAGDQGGSIRIPSAYNGVIGLKPTFGLVPYSGVLGLEYTVDHVGPIAKKMSDIALFMDCTAGPDDYDQRYYTYLKYSQFNSDACEYSEEELKNDPNIETNPVIVKSAKKKTEFEKTIRYGPSRVRVDYTKALELYKEVIPELKVAYLKEGLDNVFPEIKEVRKQSLDKLSALMKEKNGITIDEISIPQHSLATALTVIPFVEGFFDAFKNDYVTKNNFDKESYELAKAFFQGEKCLSELSFTNKILLILGDYIKEKYGSRFYAKSQEIRKDLLHAYFEVFRKYDLIILPTIPGLPKELPKKDVNMNDYFFYCLSSIVPNTCAYNYTGFPALTINFDKVEKICPVMIVGRHFEDHRVMQFGKLIEEL